MVWLSCDRIKNRGHFVLDKTKSHIRSGRDAAIDNVFPIFDSYQPDTKFNKKRFYDFFGFAPTPDVKNIYCFNDQIGIDSKFLFSFTCNENSVFSIVRHLNLTKSDKPDNSSIGLWQRFSWWDSTKIVTLNPYVRNDSSRFYIYLWYDKDQQKAWYIDFDM